MYRKGLITSKTPHTVEFFSNWPIKIGRDVGVLLLPTKKNWPQKLAGVLAGYYWQKKLAGQNWPLFCLGAATGRKKLAVQNWPVFCLGTTTGRKKLAAKIGRRIPGLLLAVKNWPKKFVWPGLLLDSANLKKTLQ